MAAIDNELNNAKTFNELQAVLRKMSEFVRVSFGDSCKPPTQADVRLFCGNLVTKAKAPVEELGLYGYEYLYEKHLWQMACVNIGVDSEETIKKKIQAWWGKYKLSCKCDSTTFNVPNGNILKFALSQNQMDFFEVLVSNYSLDINFIDPADNKNLLDYLNDEIEKRKIDGSSKTTIEIYEKYMRQLIDLGAKPSR